MFSSGSRVVVQQCRFEDTHSGLLGGAVFGAQAVSVADSVFQGTSSDIDGGAVFGAAATVTRTAFVATAALQARAGRSRATRTLPPAAEHSALLATSPSQNPALRSNFYYPPSQRGGAVFGTTVVSDGCSFNSTTAGTTGGAIFAVSRVTAVSSRFVASTATVLGWDLDQGGGAIATTVSNASTGSNLTVIDCDFDSCSSVRVRAARFFPFQNIQPGTPPATCRAGSLTGRIPSPPPSRVVAQGRGGAVQSGNVTISRSRFVNGSALFGGAVSTGLLQVEDSSFDGNAASVSGGAVHVFNTSGTALVRRPPIALSFGPHAGCRRRPLCA